VEDDWYYHEPLVPEKQFVCPQPGCGKRFASWHSLHNHGALHEGKTTCDVCGKVESTRSNLARHVKNHHQSFL
jgi:uncharacterized Zn-finger protein